MNVTPPSGEFISYSANFEDVYLNRVFAKQDAGFYVDIGAAHPLFENDTKALYDRGWRGINVEPNPEFFDTLASERPRDRNLRLIVSDCSGVLTFYQVIGTGLSTADAEQAARARARDFAVVECQVPTDTLAHILAEADPPPIDLLKVDVEGYELKVLKSNDWSRFRPRLIIVEATYPETPVRRPDEVTPYLEQHGYRYVFFDGLNDYYAENSFEVPRDAFDRPVNIFDHFIPVAQVHARQAREFLDEQVTSLTDQVRSLNQQVDSSSEQIRSLTSHISSLEEQCATLRARSQELGTAAKELRQLRHISDAQAIDLARATAEIAAMRARSASLAAQLDQALLRAAEQAILQAAELERALAHQAALNTELEILRGNREQVTALLQSTSWRITRPLRALRRPARTVRALLGSKS